MSSAVRPDPEGRAGTAAPSGLGRRGPSWKRKALVQRVLSGIPAGHRINFQLQRHVTHGLPISDAELRAATDTAIDHVRTLAGHGGPDVFFEFGAGPDLHIPLTLWALGVEQQVIVDIRPLARADLVADVARRLAGPMRRPEFVRTPPDPAGVPLGAYLDRLGISYRAPCDAAATGLPDGSVGCVTSTNTLEHIPPVDIARILRECRRILAANGMMSLQIDYMDHYSYFDPSISAFNFLVYDERDWERYNSSLHFQNRLRHADYLGLLEAAGFTVLDEGAAPVTEADVDVVRALPPAARFTDRTPADLAVRAARLIAVPAAVSAAH